MEFVEESAEGTKRGPADLVLCLGAGHALSAAEPPGHTLEALRELRRLVSDGGRVVFGEGFWERPPTPAEPAGMWLGAEAGQHYDLARLVGLAVEAGFRAHGGPPVRAKPRTWGRIGTASRDEWEEFESAYQADTEVWLAGHPDHPRAAETRADLDRHRARWLTYRGILGIVHLTLVPVAAAG